MTQVERIKAMEKHFQESEVAIKKMQEALLVYEEAQGAWKKLCDYYGSVKWMQDYEDDQLGKLPKGLKRGVLSEDGVYDLIQEHHEITSRLLKIIAKNVEGYRG